MKVAHYYPNPFMNKFTKHTEVQFMNNTCDSSVDLIYCGSISRLPKAYEAKKKYKKPLVCWVWDIPVDWRNWFTNDNLGISENKHRDKANEDRAALLKKCDLVISASKYTQNTLLETYGIKSKQIYFYIDTDELDSVKQPEKKDQVVQISRYFYNKRFEISIEAMIGINANLACIGTPQSMPYYDKLVRSRDAMHLDVQLHSSIPRNKCISILKESKLLVSPSVFEGWGITPIEALYCGIPVLLNDLPVFKEVYGDTVMYHEYDNPLDMHSKINTILNNKEIQTKMIHDTKPIISKFTPTKFAQRWKKVITTL